jgi:hypothetical protein
VTIFSQPTRRRSHFFSSTFEDLVFRTFGFRRPLIIRHHCRTTYNIASKMRQSFKLILASVFLLLSSCACAATSRDNAPRASNNRKTRSSNDDNGVPDPAAPVPVHAISPPTVTPVLPPTHRPTRHPTVPATVSPTAPPSESPTASPKSEPSTWPWWAYATLGAVVLLVVIVVIRVFFKKDEGYQQVPEISLNV